jgi:phage tail tube protein FII
MAVRVKMGSEKRSKKIRTIMNVIRLYRMMSTDNTVCHESDILNFILTNNIKNFFEKS